MVEAVAARAFERFYRSDEPLVQAEAGSGLGLAVVRAVVEAYGGTVRAESAGPGSGSRFTVSLAAWRPPASPSRTGPFEPPRLVL